MKQYNDLDTDDLYNLADMYNNYIIDFDYVNSGQPVSIYEFYDNEYQEIDEKPDKQELADMIDKSRTENAEIDELESYFYNAQYQSLVDDHTVDELIEICSDMGLSD